MGGAVAAIPHMKSRLVEANSDRLGRIERGEQVVVGVNRYREAEPSPLTAGIDSIFTTDPAAEADQITRLHTWRVERDGVAVNRALLRLREAALSGENIMPPSIAAVRDPPESVVVGRTTADNPVPRNTFLIWNGEVRDFELEVVMKVVGNNSGVQYRSKLVDAKGFVISGYQGDFEAGKTYSGILYEEKGRGILAKRGEKVVVKEGADAKKPKIEVTGSLGKTEEIQAKINAEAWNEYRVVAKGGHLQHFINGVQTVDVTDETAVGARKGLLALQLHAGPPMVVQFKDLVLKEIK